MLKILVLLLLIPQEQTSSTPSNGAVVKIERQTPDTARLVDFQDWFRS